MESKTLSEGFQAEFPPGSSVIYAMHGKCNVVSTETRSLGGEAIRFYKLEIKKSALSRSNKTEPAIWVPISRAKDQGLRAPMTKEEAEAVLKVLSSREYYFKANEPWNVIQPLLEAAIRIEGGLGLAKVASFLYVMKKKQVVSSPEVNKLQETVHRLLFKELSEILEETPKNLEQKIIKGFRVKMTPDA